jgi:hypothetical protein
MTAVEKFPRLSGSAGASAFTTFETLGPEVYQPLKFDSRHPKKLTASMTF